MAATHWKDFERLVAAIHASQAKGAQVTWDDHIDGRQFDVTLRFKFGMHSYLTVIECKHTQGKVNVERVDALVTKARDVKANKAILVSASGYQTGCFPVAEKHGIELLTLNEKMDVNLDKLIATVSPGLSIYHVSFGLPNGTRFPFEDEGGSLTYLVTKSTISTASESISPAQVVENWQWTGPALNLDDENAVLLPLAADSILHVPYEDSVKVKDIAFKCRVIQIARPNQPVFDKHIMAAISTKYELKNEKGELIKELSFNEIDLGFDTKVAIEKFYVNRKLSNYYYCKNIDGDNITWMMVESYQFGRLIRGTFMQDKKYAGQFEEVTDEKKLKKLNLLLEDLRELEKNKKKGLK